MSVYLVDREFDHVTADALETFKVERSKVKVTASRNVSAVKRCMLDC